MSVRTLSWKPLLRVTQPRPQLECGHRLLAPCSTPHLLWPGLAPLTPSPDHSSSNACVMETKGSGLRDTNPLIILLVPSVGPLGGRKHPDLARGHRPPGHTRAGVWEAEGSGQVQKGDGAAGAVASGIPSGFSISLLREALSSPQRPAGIDEAVVPGRDSVRGACLPGKEQQWRTCRPVPPVSPLPVASGSWNQCRSDGGCSRSSRGTQGWKGET